MVSESIFLNLECKDNSDTSAVVCVYQPWCAQLEWDHVVQCGEQPAWGSGHAGWRDFQDDKK